MERPQRSSPGWLGWSVVEEGKRGKEAGGNVAGGCCGMGKWRGRITWLYDVDELFADGEHQDFLPKVLGLRFGDAERPGATFDVAGILPYGLHAALEEMHRVLQLEGVEREGVQDLPKWFGGDDVLFQEGEAAFVVLRLGVFVVVECPRVLEGWRSKVADEGQSAGDLGVFVLGDWA